MSRQDDPGNVPASGHISYPGSVFGAEEEVHLLRREGCWSGTYETLQSPPPRSDGRECSMYAY